MGLGGLVAAAPGYAEVRVETLRWVHPEPAEVAGFAVYIGVELCGSTRFHRIDLGLPVPDEAGVYASAHRIALDKPASFWMTAYGDPTPSGVLESEASNRVDRWSDSRRKTGGRFRRGSITAPTSGTPSSTTPIADGVGDACDNCTPRFQTRAWRPSARPWPASSEPPGRT